VDLQEGKIFLHSEPGQGSTFTVHLPFEMGEGNSTHASIKSVSVDGFFSTFQSASVLVVEDNAINQLLVKKVLEKSGCKTDIASNGVEALERLKLQRYDIILMDIQMPEMDGYEATRQIRNLSSPTSEIPILAMTAHAFGSDVSRCLEAGMNDFISKPFKPEVLFAKMKKHLDRSKQLKVVSLPRFNEVSIDLAPLHQLGDGDPGFLNELVLLYDEQTPAFIERLRGYLKSHNFGAIRSICHQVKSSYGILNMSELGSSLEEISRLLKTEKPAEELTAITRLVTTIISLISAITEELRRNLRKTA
jgi:CheY-like chemotaxis protein